VCVRVRARARDR